jgi:Mrp family chromosome partitioning ATPase
MRLRRGRAAPVLAEVPTRRGPATRSGALRRDELEAYSRLAGPLGEARFVLATGPAKSRVAVGLAAVATAAGRRVALVEADLADPSLASALGLEPVPGLHEHLRGEVESQAALQSLVLAGPAAGGATEPLACVPAGEPGPPSLLDSDRCRQALAGLQESYELVVVDGVPLDGDRLALIALAEVADATLACGPVREVRGKQPIPITGLVLAD